MATDGLAGPTTTRSCAPWWPVVDGRFSPFALHADHPRLPAEAATLVDALRRAELPGAVFLRGSMVESHAPFAGADVDVLIVGDEPPSDEDVRRIRASTHRWVDLKALSPSELAREPVQRSLLTHRSVQVCGAPFTPEPVRADASFAQAQWLAWFPAGLPPAIDAADRLAVHVFKCAVRSYGVLSLLQGGLFTRDVEACLGVTDALDPPSAAVLRGLRRALETGTSGRFELAEVRRRLLQLRRETGDGRAGG